MLSLSVDSEKITLTYIIDFVFIRAVLPKIKRHCKGTRAHGADNAVVAAYPHPQGVVAVVCPRIADYRLCHVMDYADTGVG